jgi:hypothetical protein
MTCLRWMTTAVLLGALAHPVAAAPAVTIQARMFLRSTGELDADVLKGGPKARIGNLDYGVLARELLIDVAVPEGTGDHLVVTVKQGKMSVTQSWKVEVGGGYAVRSPGHFPLLVSPIFCGGVMTITSTVGRVTETRTIDFTCSE